MSKRVRLEIRVTVIAHVGDDLAEDGAPERDQDATESFRMVRVAHVGPMVHARDVAAGHLTSMVGGAVSGIAERLRHDLREKGF